jgi:pimeloyl-ACP methyl ester carboxylesterase
MIHKSRWGPVYYEVSGPQEAQVVVFTHGITLDHATFDPQVNALRDKYRVVVWDMPGHGSSFPVDGDFRFTVVAGCLVGLLDELGASSAVLVGQSVGSLVNQYAAHNYPERVEALVDVGGTPLHQGMKGVEAFMWRLLLRLSVLIPERMLYRWFARERAFTKATQDDLEAAISRMGKKQVLNLTRAYLKDYAAGIPKAPGVPLLIINGEHEIALVRRKSAEWHASAPESQLAVIPEAGHIANQDNPAAFNRVLESFLAGLASDTAKPAFADALAAG